MKRTLAFTIVLFVTAGARGDDTFLKQSRGVNHPTNIDEWRKKETRSGLKPYPNAPAGYTASFVAVRHADNPPPRTARPVSSLVR